ncbi:MAG: trigger factor [Myxococcales bacterium]|nr:trigger factor [Myxococcales bacterium]
MSMQLQIEDLSPIRKRVQVTVPAARVNQGFAATYKQLAARTRLPGFRRGKVPMGHLQKRFKGQATADVTEMLVQEGWTQALDQHNVRPVGRPEVDTNDRPHEGQDFSFSIEVEVVPDIELKAYDSLSVERVEWNASDAVVEHEIEHLREHVATFKPVTERTVAERGDMVVLDFKGSVDGVEFAGGSAENFELELGSGRFIPGFEDQVTGQTVGEAFDVNVTFPEDYGAEDLAGKAAVFACKINELKAKALPEIGDELASELGEENMDAVRAKVREQVQDQHRRETDNDAKNALQAAIAAAYDFDLPPSLLNSILEEKKSEAVTDLIRGGTELEAARTEVEGKLAELTKSATDDLRVELVLEAVAEKEGVEVTEHEVTMLVEQIARGAGQYAVQVRQMYRDQNRRAGLRRRMRQDKVLDFLLDKANVTVVNKEVPEHDHGHDHDHADHDHADHAD